MGNIVIQNKQLDLIQRLKDLGITSVEELERILAEQQGAPEPVVYETPAPQSMQQPYYVLVRSSDEIQSPFMSAMPHQPIRGPMPRSNWFLLGITRIGQIALVLIILLTLLEVTHVYRLKQVWGLVEGIRGDPIPASGEDLHFDATGVLVWRTTKDCAATFKALNGDSTLAPPPPAWPASDRDTLLIQQRDGCVPSGSHLAVVGFYKDTTWIVVTVPTVAQPKTASDWKQVWTDGEWMGVDRATISSIPGVYDISEKVGKVILDQVAQSVPTMTPVPTIPPAPNTQPQEQPAQPPAETGNQAPPPPADTPVPPSPTQVPASGAVIGEITGWDGSVTQFVVTPVPSPTAAPTMLWPNRRIANNGTPYSDECMILYSRYKDKTSNDPIPGQDFSGLVNCGIKGTR